MKKQLTVALMTALCLSGGVSFAEAPAAAETAVKPCHMDLVLVIDKSGSMYGLEKDTIGGFNSLIEKQKKEDIPVNVTTVLFDTNNTILHNRTDIGNVGKMTDKEYIPSGSTALLDAVGNTITRMDAVPGINGKTNKVLFVVITDGLENSSKEYTKDNIRHMISDRTEKDNWEFMYLGANIDAVGEAKDIGISGDNAVKYQNTSSGVRANYAAIAEFASARAKGDASQAWKDQVEKDEDTEEGDSAVY